MGSIDWLLSEPMECHRRWACAVAEEIAIARRMAVREFTNIEEIRCAHISLRTAAMASLESRSGHWMP
jgi:hypothetical protein